MSEIPSNPIEKYRGFILDLELFCNVGPGLLAKELEFWNQGWHQRYQANAPNTQLKYLFIKNSLLLTGIPVVTVKSEQLLFFTEVEKD